MNTNRRSEIPYRIDIYLNYLPLNRPFDLAHTLTTVKIALNFLIT